MKKQIIIGSLLALAITGSAQTGTWTYGPNKITTTNTVGIGTTAPTTGNPLEVETSSPEKGIMITQKLTGSNVGAAALHLKNNSTGGNLWSFFSLGSGNTIPGAGNFVISNFDGTNYYNRLLINKTNGNVGIGTTSPLTQLQVNTPNTNDGIRINQSGTSAAALQLFHSQSGGGNWGILSYGVGSPNLSFYDYNAGAANYPLFINGTIPSVVDPNDGFVGIGTSTPSENLEVYTSSTNGGIKINQAGNTASTLRLGHTTSSQGNWALMGFGSGTTEGAGNFGIYDQNAPATRFFIAGSSTNPPGVNAGNVGIGTYIPTAKLAVSATGTAISVMDGSSSNSVKFKVMADGSTAIADNYIPSGYKLAVNGNAIFTEVWVRLRNDWPDYVFNKNYSLMSIKDLESYIQKNKHLPGFESAKEIEKADAFSVNEMQTKLLEKIEELTLYVIQLENKLNALKNEKK